MEMATTPPPFTEQQLAWLQSAFASRQSVPAPALEVENSTGSRSPTRSAPVPPLGAGGSTGPGLSMQTGSEVDGNPDANGPTGEQCIRRYNCQPVASS